jgi:hypothetical protein
MLNPKNGRVFLPMIREAFSQPALIAVEANRKPQVTLLLLDHIRQKLNDEKISADVEETASFVRDHAI